VGRKNFFRFLLQPVPEILCSVFVPLTPGSSLQKLLIPVFPVVFSCVRVFQRLPNGQTSLITSNARVSALTSNLRKTRRRTPIISLPKTMSARQVGDEKARRTQYYLYVMEANLAFRDGMRIPLMSEFLDYGQGDNEGEKQDCELRASYRTDFLP